MAQHNELGKWGEDVAVKFLRSKGFDIIERDWRSGHRDIDIIALEGDIIHFVEVKTRSSIELSSPVYTIPFAKRRNLMIAINHYIKSKYLDNNYQFDIITIIGQINSTPKIEYMDDIRLY